LRLTPYFKIALCTILFLRTQPRKMPYYSQIFARKPGNSLHSNQLSDAASAATLAAAAATTSAAARTRRDDVQGKAIPCADSETVTFTTT